MGEQHYWVAVAARNHILSGVEQGIVQANHGKAAPLRRMKPGDRILLYAPKLVYGGAEPCQRFVAAGTIADDAVYQTAVATDFQPYRRSVIYESIAETPIQPLIEQLSFIQDKKRWGYRFRFGLFAIPQADFEQIHSKMTSNGNH